MVDTLARTATTVSSQRDNLEHTIQNAPGTLATLRTFLGRLDHLTASVRPAARLIASAAPALSRALAQIPSFQRAAVPTLDKATTVSRVLTSLADGATPVLRRAVPVTRTLATLSSSALPPVTSVLDRSEDNVFAILDNWSRAIQFRDGLGHIFRGSAGVAPDMLDSAIRRALGRDGSRPKVPRKPSLPDLHKSGPVAGALPKPPAVDVPGKVGSILDKVEQGITHVTAPKPPPPPARPPSPPTPDKGLLDYLLKP
jgi:ABC-type transporter Mla subunit MlaD